jgi:hypothetical protein
MAMSKKDRDAEIQRLAMSALGDLEALVEDKTTFDGSLEPVKTRMLVRARDELARRGS